MFKIFKDMNKKEEVVITTYSIQQFIPLFNQAVTITVEGLQTSDVDVGEYVMDILKRDEKELLQNTIKAATTWIEEMEKVFALSNS